MKDLEDKKLKLDLDVKKKEVIFKRPQKGSSIIEVPFDKIFDNPKYSEINTFILNKKNLYVNIGDIICGYINYFIAHYDEDDELLTAYLQLKFMIDDSTGYSKSTFIEDLYDYILSDTMIEKIKQMTNDLYCINLEKEKKTKKKYSETLQFINEHGIILMNISTAMKIMIPLVAHYAHVNRIKKNISKFLIKVYIKLLDIFQGDHNIYNKLYETVYSRVKSTIRKDKTIWKQGDIRGVDMLSSTSEIVDKLIIDIFPKYLFSGNLVHLNSKCIDNNVNFIMRSKYDVDYKPITTTKDTDGLSGFDKLEVITSKFDESSVIISNINIKHTLNDLADRNFVKMKKKEVRYYMDNIKVDTFQKELIFQYFAKYFGSPQELYRNQKQYCKLIIIFKKILADRGFRILQHLLTGEVVGFENPKKSLVKKIMTKIEASPRYKELMDYKYSSVSNMIEKIIENYVKRLLFSDIKLVDYDMRENTGNTINNKKYIDLISDELLRLISEF